MLSDEHTGSDDMLQFFEDCLHQHGLEDVNVLLYDEDDGFSSNICVRKKLADGTMITYKTSISPSNATDKQLLKKQLAAEAEAVARQITEQLTTTFDWANISVDVSIKDGGHARCNSCGATVETPSTMNVFEDSSETTDPAPVGRDIGRQLSQMDERQRNIYKLYLIALLKRTCDVDCPNRYGVPKDLNRSNTSY